MVKKGLDAYMTRNKVRCMPHWLAATVCSCHLHGASETGRLSAPSLACTCVAVMWAGKAGAPLHILGGGNDRRRCPPAPPPPPRRCTTCAATTTACTPHPSSSSQRPASRWCPAPTGSCRVGGAAWLLRHGMHGPFHPPACAWFWTVRLRLNLCVPCAQASAPLLRAPPTHPSCSAHRLPLLRPAPPCERQDCGLLKLGPLAGAQVGVRNVKPPTKGGFSCTGHMHQRLTPLFVSRTDAAPLQHDENPRARAAPPPPPPRCSLYISVYQKLPFPQPYEIKEVYRF